MRKIFLCIGILGTALTLSAQESAGPTTSGSAPHTPPSGGAHRELMDSEQKQEARKRTKSMGGAPNVGAGMGTGTGAGSRVGPETGEGASSSGAMGAPEEEMYENAPEDIQREELNLGDEQEFGREDLPAEAGPAGPEAQEALEEGRLEDNKKEQERKQQGE